ncbi:hypothetical protein JCM10212_000872 [Sporobolomyces blumeae]
MSNAAQHHDDDPSHSNDLAQRRQNPHASTQSNDDGWSTVDSKKGRGGGGDQGRGRGRGRSNGERGRGRGRGGRGRGRGGDGGASQLDRHRPVTDHDEQHVYPLTLRLTRSLDNPLNDLRTKYFPRDRLKVAGHLTLFHALPHSRLNDVKDVVQDVTRTTAPFRVRVGNVFKMGPQGVAIDPDERAIERGRTVHGALRSEFEPFLSKQDAKAFRAHWTIMNKEGDPDKVERALEEVKEWARTEGKDKEGVADGIVLWRYDHGNWVFEQEWSFEG